MMGLWAAAVAAAVGCLGHALAMPLPQEGSGGERAWSGREYVEAGLGVAALLTSVTTLLACACCKRSRGFKELGSVSSRVAGSSSTLTQGPREEITLFPPAGLSVSTTQINFEPLPDIRPRPAALGHSRPASDKTLPPFFSGRSPASPSAAATTPTDEWFAQPHQNFPRNQLQYVRELGRGWFGQVLEGRAAGVFSDHTKGESPVGTTVGSGGGLTPVAVKVLREDASPSEQQYFLQELRPYRDLAHSNVLRVLAHCLEAEPFLILLELCPRGDLKGVLRNDKTLSEVTLLRMTLDVASGLAHMHAHNFIHTDLAARNCVVEEDNTVKIGDYGFSLDSYKDEYYCAGDVALPLRWCSPETLKCTDTTIETKEVTKAANVWSFGVVMWEVASRGDLPYGHLDHEQVIQEVIVDQTSQLDLPPNLQLHAGKLYNIMKQCWEREESRPSMAHTHSLLAHLWEHAASTLDQDIGSLGDFEQRWNQLQQQDCRDHSIMHTGNTASLRFESDFNLPAVGPHPLGEAMSPSLQNLHGSAEDLEARVDSKFRPLPSWLGVEPGQQIDSLTQEITDAILKLDDYLAGEKSEPSTGQTSPEKGGVNFKLGKDSFVSNPPESIVARMGGLSIEDGRGHPSLTGALSEEEEGFSMKLEQGAFTEMVRLKSQSVQDFMKLTVVDDASDSDTTSQRNSLGFEPLTQEKTFSSEGNIKEALRDAKFMGELERLQAEHRYSIITEVSRECASSIEYRNQGLNGDAVMREDQQEDEAALGGSTDRLIVGGESEDSNNSHDRIHSEQDPFLCKIISSEATEETVKKVCDSREGKSESTDEVDNCVEAKPLPASPDCVVSSREPKPVTLPDIVVHNGGSNLAHSTPSPPPSPSALTHINSNQRKEFRFIFGDESVDGSKNAEKDLPESTVQVNSVVFSENITEEADGRGLKDSEQEKGILGTASTGDNSVIATEQVLKANCINSFNDKSDSHDFALNEKHFAEGLTSTPYKAQSLARTEMMEVKDKLQNFGCVTSEFSDISASPRNITDESADANSTDDLEAKQRLLFSPSDSENKNTSDKAEYGEKECLPSIKENSVPSYTPEEIVKGEEVVIGALDDYSLELYKAVKSTEAPPVSPGIDAPSIGGSECAESKAGTEIQGIEFDLDQWDKFLGKTLSRENSCSDPVFMETIGNEDIRCDAVNDVVALGFEQDKDCTINKVENISATASSDISDFVSPVFYSANEAVSNSPAATEMTSQVVEFSHMVNSSTDTQKDSKVSPLSETVNDHQQSVQSEESYHTAASGVFTSPEDLNPDKSPTPVHNSTTIPNSSASAGTEEAVMEESLCSSWGDLDTSVPFSYKKEAPVDTSFEQPSEIEPVSTKTNLKLELDGGVFSPSGKKFAGTPDPFTDDTVDSVVHPNNSTYSLADKNFQPEKCPENLLKNSDGDSVAKSLSFSKSNDIMNCLEAEHSSSDTIGISSALQFGSPGSATHTTLIIKGEDDLSPSAYQGSWSARGERDGAPESDELENGDFWEQQMVAWQAAAFQTRQLLQEAAGQGVEGAVEEQNNTQEDEEVSPRSDASSSSKSLYSSTDLLNLDDEGTYVSYNTTDEEEVLGYRPEDISALRAELSLKLETGHGESQEQEPDEPEDSASLDRDNVVINYRGIISSTLSPIKEESFLEEEDTPRRGSRGNAVEGDSALDCSIEFEEPASNECEETKSNTFVLNNSNINQQSVPSEKQPSVESESDTMVDNASGHSIDVGSRIAGDASGTSLENTHNSLILEDLDEEDGPTSIQIYNSGTSLDAEDILVVNTETNEATILDQGIPRSHLAFVIEQEQPPEASPLHPFGFEDTDDVAPESIPSEEGRHLHQQQRHEQVLSSKPSWDQTGSQETHEYDGSSESKSTTEFVITNNDASSSSPDGIQVPAYHSYFTSALSTISHPNASIEEPPLFEQVEQISLPYEVNYPPPAALEDEEELHSLEDVQQQQGDGGSGSHNISEIEDDEDAPPIKLSFLGRLYSDEDKEEQHKKLKAEREATLLSDSEGEDAPEKLATHSKTQEPSSLKQMTSAEFLASEKYKTNDAEEVEEQLTAEADSEEDSEEENSYKSPHKREAGSPSSQEPRYTPDWESDTDTDDDSSSTSGEFMWKPGEPCQPAPYILDIIEEETNEDEEREEGELSEDSESGEEEFTPSQWNSDLTPSHSLLKSPQNKSSLKKRVRWKRQRHHRVYEYPPEPRSWEHSLTEPQYRRSWGRSSLDYLSLADWELGADEFIADESEDMEDYVYHKPSRPAPPPPIYSLGSMTYDEAAEGFLVDNGEFFIRSSGSPFTFTRSSFSASDFFPGGHSSDYDVIFGSTAQSSAVPFSNCKVADCPAEDNEEQVTYSSKQERQLEEDLQTSVSTQEENEQQLGGSASLGQLRHTRDKLRLEIPSLTLTGDSNKGSSSTLENGRSGLECSEQNFVILNHNRVEPEVSEV